jgi:hypothetical protein
MSSRSSVVDLRVTATSLASDEPELVPPDLPLGLVHPQAREKKLQEPL